LTFVEFNGTARLDKRTKRLVKRLGPDDIAIIDHPNLDRISAEELLERRARRERSSATGVPEPAPPRPGGQTIDAPGADLLSR
jgi:hypothetical protein